MAVAFCKTCKKEFYVKPSWLKKGHGIYCCMKCKRVGQRNGKLVKCFKCSKEVYRSLKYLNKSKSKNYFCSKKCNLIWVTENHTGDKHGNWKNGEFAYKDIIKRSKITPECRMCKKADKRILLVHHIDHNRKNNNIKNLAWLCYNCHFLIHHYFKIEQDFLRIIQNNA